MPGARRTGGAGRSPTSLASAGARPAERRRDPDRDDRVTEQPSRIPLLAGGEQPRAAAQDQGDGAQHLGAVAERARQDLDVVGGGPDGAAAQ